MSNPLKRPSARRLDRWEATVKAELVGLRATSENIRQLLTVTDEKARNYANTPKRLTARQLNRKFSRAAKLSKQLAELVAELDAGGLGYLEASLNGLADEESQASLIAASIDIHADVMCRAASIVQEDKRVQMFGKRGPSVDLNLRAFVTVIGSEFYRLLGLAPTNRNVDGAGESPFDLLIKFALADANATVSTWEIDEAIRDSLQGLREFSGFPGRPYRAVKKRKTPRV